MTRSFKCSIRVVSRSRIYSASDDYISRKSWIEKRVSHFIIFFLFSTITIHKKSIAVNKWSQIIGKICMLDWHSFEIDYNSIFNLFVNRTTKKILFFVSRQFVRILLFIVLFLIKNFFFVPSWRCYFMSNLFCYWRFKLIECFRWKFLFSRI